MTAGRAAVTISRIEQRFTSHST